MSLPDAGGLLKNRHSQAQRQSLVDRSDALRDRLHQTVGALRLFSLGPGDG